MSPLRFSSKRSGSLCLLGMGSPALEAPRTANTSGEFVLYVGRRVDRLRPGFVQIAGRRQVMGKFALGILQIEGVDMRIPTVFRCVLERAFDADLSRVVVRESSLPVVLGAEAFACGEQIHFTPGRFRPEEAEGLAVLVPRSGSRVAATLRHGQRRTGGSL